MGSALQQPRRSSERSRSSAPTSGQASTGGGSVAGEGRREKGTGGIVGGGEGRAADEAGHDQLQGDHTREAESEGGLLVIIF